MKTYCIILPEYEDVTKAAVDHFESVGLKDVHFFWGINAPIAGLATSHFYDLDHPGSNYRMGAKPTGIWLSHYMLWSHLVHLDDDRFLILEADANLEPNWKARFDQALADAPSNADIVYIGSCCCEGHPKEHVAGDVYKMVNMQCTHAYVIRRGVLPFMLKRMRKIWAPIDIQMQIECFPSLLTYAVLPRIVSQFNTVLPP